MGREILLFGILCFSLRVVYGCQLQGVAPGLARVMVNIWDYERGDVYENQVISITDVVNIVQSGVNSGPYISGRLEGTTFYLTTTASYELYENVETLNTFALTAQFRCLDGTTITQVFQVNVQDTNNHSPEFLPTGEYDIAIATPLLPGHQITGCQHNIVVRDIDLTTYRIDFGLTGSDLFEIEYDEASSTTAKEFVAVLRTTTFIRTLSETVELTISATDVDETGNDPRTTYATVRITADSDAELPEEPVFSQPLYTATYTENDNIVLDDIIALQQGYNEQVEFSLNEEYRLYFGIIRNGNVLSLNVTNPLSEDILTRHQIYLVIRADREFTSGATATIVVQLPDEIHLQFERSIYEGIIEDNTLDLPNIILSQGYKDTSVSISVSNEYFSADIQGNEITLTMEPLSQVIIDENTYLNLELVARTDRSVATAMVTLEIIKNDSTTPLFQNPVYIGSYNIDDNVILDPIEIIQGFDDTVVVELDGEHSGHFELIRNGAISKLSVRDTLPLEVLGEQTIILTIHATKFRTIGAAASIYITLPEEIKLEFERGSYEGTIADNTLELPSIILTQGYENYEVFVDVLNEFFAASIQNNNLITLTMMEQLAEDVIKANSFLNLVVTATTSRSSASTIVTLEIIKNDTTTPQFHSALYSGTYSTSGELILDQIHIVQGYDESVEVTLDGEHVSLFQLIRNEASSTVTVDAIPPAIFRERNIALTVTATKPRTVGATAVINIALPTDRLLEFEEINYKGSYQNGNLTVESLVLITGYDGTVDFDIDGEHKQYFEVSNNLYQVSIEMIEPLPNSVVLENSFLQLVVIASGINALPATASLTIEIIKDDVSTPLFGQNIYSIAYDSENIELNNINIIQGFDSTVSFRLDGDDSRYFSLSEVSNGVTLSLKEDIPEDVIFNKKTLIFSVLAEKPLTVGSHTTIVITFPPELTNIAVMRFSQNTYIGSLDGGVLNLNPIILGTGYKQDTEFLLTGDYYSYFTLYDTNEVVTITTSDLTLPQEVVENNKFIVLEVEARRERAESVFTSVVIEIIHEVETVETPIFNAAYYRGNYNLEEGLQFTDPIHLVQGYDYSVSFDLQGDYSEHFSVSDDKNVITLSANDVPVNVWENNHQLILTIVASKPEVINVTSALVIDMSKDIDHNVTVLEFERTSYIGFIENDIVTIQPITLTEGYTEDVVFTLIGDLESFFAYTRDEATIILRLDGTIPEESIPTNGIIVLGIQASTPTDSLPAVTTVILEVIRDDKSTEVENLVFAQTYYVGTYNATTGVALENPISLSEGFNDTVQFNLDGDSSTYFSIAQDENSVTLTVRETIPPAVIANNNQLIFVINAQSANGASAQATVVILLLNEVDEDMPVLGFERTSYVGSIENDIVTIQPITLTEGYTDDVIFTLIGDFVVFFELSRNGATVNVELENSIPSDVLPENGIIILGIQASLENIIPAVTTVILEIKRSGGSTASFSKVLYEGSLHDQAVQHETITVAGTEETTVDIRGVYEELFKASLSEGVVTVERTGSVTLPSDVTHVAIEIQVGDAAAVLLLQVFHTDTPSPPPSVTFSSPSYVIRADILHTGIIGIVSATADNGESLDYTLDVENAHLAARLAVNSNGELLVSSPVDAGEYFFQVVATTRITQAAGEATVYLSIDVTGITLPPLIVLDRDEEVAHENLVVFNGTDYAGCSFTVTNRFPINHDWLYVDETGLHARVINREDPSIAFMALSQVQVELEVHCNTLARNKRSVRESRLDWLGPYDYGTSTWILGESIAHDPSRSVVNLIVNDINDNPPIFVGKENEPIAVGYPIPELEDVVLPRALVQLEATDADVGENAALVYWSAEPELAVSPSSGSVHVREVVALRHDQPLVVHATDRRGQGLSGAVKLLVKLLDVTEIAVVTVRNAFLEDETNIIANLSESIGHEVRVLRAVVISDDTEDINGLNTRRKRQTNGAGATLQLYVYGLIEREPIAADILIENINSNATGVVSIADTISLEDHLEARQIHSGRDIGLLVATIVLSVLLFILIVAILVWLFLKWRKARKNEEFSDENSLESRNESIVQPEKDDFRPKPRINIDDLKRSERRLQEMIEVPYNEPVIPATSKNESQIESINDISQPDPNILMPIVIKDKLKDAVEDLSDTDEFGEVRLPRRKSVVTFNENVEKIIHVDDNVEGSSISSDVEMFRF